MFGELLPGVLYLSSVAIRADEADVECLINAAGPTHPLDGIASAFAILSSTFAVRESSGIC